MPGTTKRFACDDAVRTVTDEAKLGRLARDVAAMLEDRFSKGKRVEPRTVAAAAPRHASGV